jgi:hypothetical protein
MKQVSLCLLQRFGGKYCLHFRRCRHYVPPKRCQWVIQWGKLLLALDSIVILCSESRKVGKHLPDKTVSQPRRPQYSLKLQYREHIQYAHATQPWLQHTNGKHAMSNNVTVGVSSRGELSDQNMMAVIRCTVSEPSLPCGPMSHYSMGKGRVVPTPWRRVGEWMYRSTWRWVVQLHAPALL